LDTTESDDLVWELYADPNPCPPDSGKKAQDLAIKSFRVEERDYPIIDSTDTIVTVVRNVYGEVCSPYDSIIVDFYMDEGYGASPIGSVVLTAADQDLIDFNNGTTDSIVVVFAFTPMNPTYIFTEDHPWNSGDRNPRYKTALRPFPFTPCPDWIVMSALTRGTANDTTFVSFERPLPDFTVDTVFAVEMTPYVKTGDTLSFEMRVENRGIGWPPHQNLLHFEDSVYLQVIARHQRLVAGQWLDLYDEAWKDLITPMDTNDYYQLQFQYYPTPESVSVYAPIDRIVIDFQLNGGEDSLNSTVWERSFNNNTAEYELQFTEYVDCGFPAGSLFVNGDSLVYEYPYRNLDGICPQFVYVYLQDESFQYSPPDLEPPDVLVQIGIGPECEPDGPDADICRPSDSSWSWYPCTFVGDFTDNNSQKYKVYRGDACTLLGGIGSKGYYNYCFRASQDWLDEYSSYLYIDGNGAFEKDTTYNVFDARLAGRAENGWFLCGNVDGRNKGPDIADIIYLAHYVFGLGPPPPVPAAANVDGTGEIDAKDIAYLAAHLFKGGPGPTCIADSTSIRIPTK
jgi:hypothetical protein